MAGMARDTGHRPGQRNDPPPEFPSSRAGAILDPHGDVMPPKSQLPR